MEDALIQKLLDYGISLNAKNKQGMTSLHVHLENWDFTSRRNAVRRTLDERFHERFELPMLKIFQRYVHSDLLNLPGEGIVNQFTLCWKPEDRIGSNRVFRSPEKVDINSQDADGVTILHLAAMRSTARLFYLVEKGSDPSILTRKDRNVLHLACRARQSNIVGYLCQVSINIYYFPFSN
jgi:hypothetical protein